MDEDSTVHPDSETLANMDMPVTITADADLPAAEELRQIESAKRDPQAFAALYRRHCSAITRYLYRRTGDRHATEDLVSEVFLAALRYLPRYRHRGLSIRSWLYRIATNSANRWSRRNRLPCAPLPVGGIADPVDDSEPSTELAQWALLQLPPKHQTVLALHYLEGMTIDEVAAVIGCRSGTVKSRLSRARETLKRRLHHRR